MAKISYLSLALSIAAVILLPKPAYAYLDPGTGSYLLQILLASIFGLLFTLKAYWVQVKGYFMRNKAKPPEKNENEQQPNKSGE